MVIEQFCLIDFNLFALKETRAELLEAWLALTIG